MKRPLHISLRDVLGLRIYYHTKNRISSHIYDRIYSHIFYRVKTLP